MHTNFDSAIKLVFGSEGGYSNRKTDSGGPTKFGITARTLGAWRGRQHAATADEVKALTLEEARQILEQQYADPICFDDLPLGIDYAAFDYAVNAGPAQAAKSLQHCLGVAPDGVIGVKTLAACEVAEPVSLINRYCDERLRFLRGLGGPKGWSANGEGWNNRVRAVRAAAKVMTAKAPAPIRPVPAEVIDTVVAQGSDAKADATTTRVSATTGGKGVITVATGLVTTAGALVGSARDAIQPLAGTFSVADKVLLDLTVAGVCVAIVGLAITTYAQVRHIGSGAPV